MDTVLGRRVSTPMCVLSLCRSEHISARLTPSWLQLSHSLHHSVADEAAVEKRALNGFAPPSTVSSSQLL